MQKSDGHIDFSRFCDLTNNLHCILDKDLNFKDLNGNEIPLLNYNRKELIGRCILDFVCDIDIEGTTRDFELAKGSESKISITNLFKNGLDKFVWLQWNVIYDKENEIFFAIASDVSDVIKSERKMSQYQRRIEELQNIAKLGTWEMDVKTKDMKWSDSMYEIFKLDRKNGAPSFKEFINSVLEEDRILLIEEVNNSINTGQTYEAELRHIDGEGKLIYLIARGAPIEQNGRVHKIYGTIFDITKQKQIEKELLLSKLEAEKLAHIKQQFLANMSHEIRTPLNAMIGFTEVLGDSDLLPEQNRQVEVIQNAGKHLLGIINDILDFTKIEQGQIDLERIPFDFTRTMEGIHAQYEVLANQKGLKFELKLGDDLPKVVHGDALRLKQIIGNLVGNAFKFTARGRVVVMAELLESPNKEHLIHIAVKDTGIGIPKSKVDNIFDSFAQASIDTARKYGGTGLGLTIVKHLVELHGGSIEVKSKMGKGSVFHINIPYSLEDVKEIETPIKELEIDESTIDLSGRKLLLVEDNKMNQMLAKSVIEKWGASLDIADDGLAGLAMIKENEYEAILMDLAMPKMDGYTCLSCIRELPNSKASLPVMAMTAHAFESEVEKCKSLGFNDYITKPFKRSELKLKIHQLINNQGAFSAKIEETEIEKEVKAFIAELEKTQMGESELNARCVHFQGGVRELFNHLLYDREIELVSLAKEMHVGMELEVCKNLKGLLEFVANYGASSVHRNEVKIAIDKLLVYADALSKKKKGTA